jgi:hypothetical protein
MDAFALGTRTTPEDSYRYAMGGTVEYMGRPQKRLAPLDFLAVTDHSEYLGVVRETLDPNGPFAKSEWHTIMTSNDPKVSAEAFRKLIGSTATNKPLPEFSDPKLLLSAWDKYAAIAEQYNRPGQFTSFVGFEWSSAPDYQNLHRCVVFADKGPAMPFSAFESLDPEELWRYLERQRQKGLDVIAVPHNGNASNGLMFSVKDMSGKPLTRDYADRRMANEPLAEIIQGKGQSDTSPSRSHAERDVRGRTPISSSCATALRRSSSVSRISRGTFGGVGVGCNVVGYTESEYAALAARRDAFSRAVIDEGAVLARR